MQEVTLPLVLSYLVFARPKAELTLTSFHDGDFDDNLCQTVDSDISVGAYKPFSKSQENGKKEKKSRCFSILDIS